MKNDSTITGGPFSQVLGATVIEKNDEKIEMVMPITKAHTNSLGVLHAGAAVSLVTLAMEKVCARICSPSSIISLDVNFMRPAAQETTVKAIAYILHKDNQKVRIEGVILNKEDRLVIKASATFLLVGEPHY